IDHRLLTDIRADGHVHGRHADDSRREIGASPNGRSTRHDSNALVRPNRPGRKCVLVHEAESMRASLTLGRHGHVDELSNAKAQENSLLHPIDRSPRAIRFPLRSAHFATLEQTEEPSDDFLDVLGWRW